MNGATALVKMLSDYGVEVIFGVPGDTNVAFYQALKSVEGAPRHVMCRDERSAVYMADCYARLSGKPGVAECPSGAGAMYALPGVAEANKSSVPLILLVNDIPQPGVGRGTLTELPIEELFRSITKHVESPNCVGKLPEIVRRAFRKATGGRPVRSSCPSPKIFFTKASRKKAYRCTLRSIAAKPLHTVSGRRSMTLRPRSTRFLAQLGRSSLPGVAQTGRVPLQRLPNLPSASIFRSLQQSQVKASFGMIIVLPPESLGTTAFTRMQSGPLDVPIL